MSNSNPNYVNKATTLYGFGANMGNFKTEDEARNWLIDSHQLNSNEINDVVRRWSAQYGSKESTGTDISGLKEMVTIPVGGSTAGAMGYGEYLKNFGSDTQKNYSEAVRTANDDYYRALTTYGKNAEAMAGAGLSGSGVSDYGGAAAWASRQGAVSVAGAAKQAADAENAKSYSEYLQNYKAQQAAEAERLNAARSSTIEKAISMGSSDINMVTEYLKASGYFSDEETASYAGTIANFHGEKQKKDLQQSYIDKITTEKIVDLDTVAKQAVDGGAYATIEDAKAALGSYVETNVIEKKTAQESEQKALIAEIKESGITDLDDAVANAMYLGAYDSEEEARAALSPVVDENVALKKEADEAANIDAAIEEYNNYMAQGVSHDLALNLVGQKYSAEVTNKVRESVGETRRMIIEDNIKNLYNGSFGETNMDTVKLSDVKPESVDAYTQGLTKGSEEYNAVVEKVQNNNAVVYQKAFDVSREDYQWEDVADVLGITVGEDWDMGDMTTAVHDKLIEEVKAGNVSGEDAKVILGNYYGDEFEEAQNAGRDLKLQYACEALVQAKIDAGKLGDDSIYENAIDALIEHVDIQKTEGVNGLTYDIIFGGEKAINISDAILLGVGNGLAQTYPVTVIKENSKKGIVLDRRTPYTVEQMQMLGDLIKRFLEKQEK